ncbi:MAG: hypothetical protein WD824_05260 [Cyclobacteriaceae bacterium]
MTTHWMMFIKTLVKSSLDNYVLPGTLTGTQILWLYVIQWKRDLAAVTFASVYIICSQLDLQKLERAISSARDNQE